MKEGTRRSRARKPFPSKGKQADGVLKTILEGTSSKVGEDFLRSLTRNLALLLRVRYAFISEYLAGKGERAQTAAIWTGKEFGENFEYITEDTPCEKVIQDGKAYYPSNVQKLFPADAWLRTAGVESYLAILFFDRSGQPIGHMGVMDDKPISKSHFIESILRLFATRAGAELERKRAEGALQESEARYHSLFEESPIAMAEEDFSEVKKHIDDLRDGGIKDFETYFTAHPEAVANCATLVKVKDVNTAMLALYQTHSKDSLFKNLGAIFIEQSYPAFREELIAISKGARNCATETVGRTMTGQIRNFAVRWSVVPRYEETLARIVVSVIDITEHRRLERVLRDFVANVSHEFKTPLTVIQGSAETLLDEELKDTQDSREFLKIIHDHALRLGRLTDGLLKLSQIDAGKLELEFRSVPLSEVIEACAKTTRYKSNRKQLTLLVHCPSDLPPAWGDAGWLREVLQNLLDNAVQYTSPGGRITVQAGIANGQLKIAVSDTGIGIPRAEQERIFERFYRVDAARSRDVGGTGLGLSIAKHLAEAHGGRIEVESEVAFGSTFYVFLPAG